MNHSIYEASIWYLFSRSFRSALTEHWCSEKSAAVMKKAKLLYRQLVEQTPGIGGVRENSLEINLLSALQLAAIYLSADKAIDVDTLTKVYHDGMTNGYFFKKFLSRKDIFSSRVQEKKMKDAKKSQQRTYRYDWIWIFTPGDIPDTCRADYTQCGIYTLFCDLGISEITPAMCVLDYTMADCMGAEFYRESTLAGGGTVCDCLYVKKKEGVPN